MSTVFRKPDQIIHPYYFGDPHSKATCLWLKGLPKLTWSKVPTLFEDAKTVDPEFATFKSGARMAKWFADAAKFDPDKRSEIRSKTFPGIANAMVDQWLDFLHYKNKKIFVT